MSRGGGKSGEGGWGRGVGEKICRRCLSASSGHCSLSITSIVRYREAGEKREVGIYAEFPVFVVALGLLFPPVPRQNSSIKCNVFGLEMANKSAGRGSLSARARPSSG